ncbi:amidoligase family protein [Candidatus Uhrbacteria bacterium]|nr:amidoligase family protein [Candidatus Uhrbacteria bacterium]
MPPRSVARPSDWRDLRFGIEIEFINARRGDIELLPGWEFHTEDSLYDDRGQAVPTYDEDSLLGGEIVSPPLGWDDIRQIEIMLRRIRAAGGKANWSCSTHIHVEIAPWGEAVLGKFIDAAYRSEHALRGLVQTPPHRIIYTPPTTLAIKQAFHAATSSAARRRALIYGPLPYSWRGGINLQSFWKHGTVEYRLANGSLVFRQVERAIRLFMAFTAAVLAGKRTAETSAALADQLGIPTRGYPPRRSAPRWWWRQIRYQYVPRERSLLFLFPELREQFDRWLFLTEDKLRSSVDIRVQYLFNPPSLTMRVVAPSSLRKTIAAADVPKSQWRTIRRHLLRIGETETIELRPSMASFVRRLNRLA